MNQQNVKNFMVMGAIGLIAGFLGGMSIRYFDSTPIDINQNATGETVVEKSYVEESSVIETVKKVSPAVISIVITKDLPLYRQQSPSIEDFFFGTPFGPPQYETDEEGNIKRIPRVVGGGSGFILTKEGLALTNRHVVEDSEAEYTAVLNDGRELPVEVVSRDTLNDIAVLQIKAKEGESLDDLPTVELGNSADLQIGQRVIAIGNALAEYGNTVTTGVISATGRSITAGTVGQSEHLVNLLQTDAAINPGNSGGPLTNLNGQVIGVNVAIASGAEGIGFAIAIDDIKPLIESVRETGRIIRPFLGVRYILLDEQRAKQLKIDVENGALLVGNEAEGEFAVIPGSPADKAGLQIRDVILEIDGEAITTDTDLRTIVASKKPGDQIQLTVWRSGETFEAEVTLTEAK